MILEWIRFAVVAFCLIAGLVMLYLSVFGTYRFRFALNRIHAASITDTFALMLFVIGMIVAVGPSFTAIKFLMALTLQWCTSPLAGHMLAKFEYLTDDRLSEYCSEDDRTAPKQEEEVADLVTEETASTNESGVEAPDAETAKEENEA